MRLGIDTNVLVSAHMPGLEDHEPVRSFLLVISVNRTVFEDIELIDPR